MNSIIKRIIKLMIFNNRLFDYLYNKYISMYNSMYNLGIKYKPNVNDYDEYYHKKLNQYNEIIYELLKDK